MLPKKKEREKLNTWINYKTYTLTYQLTLKELLDVCLLFF